MAIAIKIKVATTRLFLLLVQAANPRKIKASIRRGNTKSCAGERIHGYSWPKPNMAGSKRGLRRPEKIPDAPLANPVPTCSSKELTKTRMYGKIKTRISQAEIA